jgi:two-component system response regulator WspF
MRIAIVNDLALAREVLRRLVRSVPGHEIAWMAEDGAEAVRKAAQDRPDLILMDLVMPVLDGAEATRRIMAQSPCPILLVTSSVTGNFNLVYRAMGYGGLDAVNTPTLGPDGTVRDGEGILARIAKLARIQQNADAAAWKPLPVPGSGTGLPRISAPCLPPILALGASTGGPEALARILKALPAAFPAAVVVIQHIAVDFASSLANWLQGQTCLPVRVARDGDEFKPGEVKLAGTNDHLVLRPDRRLGYTVDPMDYPYRPSVDVFFHSLVTAWPRPGIAVLLTGMGSDGAQGLLQLRQAGWHTITQDQASCVVHGMPKAAADLRAASQVLPLEYIPQAILDHLRHIQLVGVSSSAASPCDNQS